MSTHGKASGMCNAPLQPLQIVVVPLGRSTRQQQQQLLEGRTIRLLNLIGQLYVPGLAGRCQQPTDIWQLKRQ
jgi:hypothetical protein